MSKFMSKVTVANLKAQSTMFKLALVAVVVLLVWSLNYLLGGSLFIIVGWLLFIVAVVVLLALINPENAVKLVKELVAWWHTYRENFKRSLKELSEMWNKKTP